MLPRECESLTPELLRVAEIRLPESEIAGFAESTNASHGWSSGSRGECRREPLPPFGIVASRVPVQGKPPGQLECLLGFEGERGIEGAAEIVELLFEAPECRSYVDPSTSVKRNVTVPVGRSLRTRRNHPPAGIRRPVATAPAW